ncbi:hypothetical protein HRG_014638 [Hirsutella rhossiliensis]
MEDNSSYAGAPRPAAQRADGGKEQELLQILSGIAGDEELRKMFTGLGLAAPPLTPSPGVLSTPAILPVEPRPEAAQEMDRGKKRKPMTWPKWNGQPESFHFYLDRLVFKYNTDEEEGLNGNNNVVWYEILQTLPDQMMRRVEGFWRQESAKGNPDPRKFFSHLAQTFGSVQQTERAQDRLRTLIQRDSQEFGKFLPEFEETLTKAGGASWDNASKLAWLRNSISPALREQLVPVIMPKDYNEYIQRLHPIAWAFEHTAKFKALQRKQGSRGQRDQGQASGIGNIQVAGNDNTPAPSATLPAEQNARDARDHDGDVIMTVTRTQGRVREDGRTARGQVERARRFASSLGQDGSNGRGGYPRTNGINAVTRVVVSAAATTPISLPLALLARTGP